jgi:hypothetical protein
MGDSVTANLTPDCATAIPFRHNLFQGGRLKDHPIFLTLWVSTLPIAKVPYIFVTLPVRKIH